MGIGARWEDKLSKIGERAMTNTLKQNWHLGVTAFGGPPVHFKIVSGRMHLPFQLDKIQGLIGYIVS